MLKRKLAFVLALMLLLMIPLSQCQAGIPLKKFYRVLNQDLQLNEDSKGQWQKLSGDKMKVRFSVQNPPKSEKTVQAFELIVYATDIWGRQVRLFRLRHPSRLQRCGYPACSRAEVSLRRRRGCGV